MKEVEAEWNLLCKKALDDMADKMEVKFTSLHERVDEVKKLILGNGHRGLSLEVDRNTRFRKNMAKGIWVALGWLLALTTAMLTMGVRQLIGGG